MSVKYRRSKNGVEVSTDSGETWYATNKHPPAFQGVGQLGAEEANKPTINVMDIRPSKVFMGKTAEEKMWDDAEEKALLSLAELERRELIAQIPMVEKHGAYAGKGAIREPMTATKAPDGLTKEKMAQAIKDFQERIHDYKLSPTLVRRFEHELMYGGPTPWYFKPASTDYQKALNRILAPLKRKEPVEVSIPKPSNVRMGNSNRQGVFLSGCGEMTPLEAEALAKKLIDCANKARNHNVGPKVRKLGDY